MRFGTFRWPCAEARAGESSTMALLKTISHHGSSSGRLERYLLHTSDANGGNRCLAVDASAAVVNPESFAEEFELVREYYGKTDGITMRHFIISPDPEAAPTLEQVRELAYGWCQAHFGDEGQWVIAYHSDNGIIHAHVALNWVRMDGYKWRFEGREFSEIANDLHERTRALGLKCGLRDVGRKQREQVTRWSKSTGAESRIARRQGWSWKEDIRHAVRQCAPKSRSFVEMRANLERFYGIKVIERSRGGFTFIHPMHRSADNHRYMVKDYKLGRGFTGEGIEGMLGYDLSGLLEGGDVSTAAFSLRVDRRSRELGFGAARETIPKPRSYTDRLIRKSRRVGLDEVKGMADALRCMRRASDAAGNSEGGMQRVWEILTQRRDALARECAEREVVRRAVVETMAAVRSFNDTLPIQLELEGKGVLARGRFRRENADALDEHASAAEWLAAHGVEVGSAPISDVAVSNRASALNREVAGMEGRLHDANSLISDLERSIALMQRHLAPVRLRGGTDTAAPAGERDIPLAAPVRRRTKPPSGWHGRSRADAPICTRGIGSASPGGRAVDPVRQGASALCGGVEAAQALRRAQAVQRAQAIDSRIVREDDRRTRGATVDGGAGMREQQQEWQRTPQPQATPSAHAGQGAGDARRTVADVARWARERAAAARNGQQQEQQRRPGAR